VLSRANVGNMEVAFDAVREDKGDLVADDILSICSSPVLVHPRCWSGLVGRHRRSA
jgi:hypothetical protein